MLARLKNFIRLCYNYISNQFIVLFGYNPPRGEYMLDNNIDVTANDARQNPTHHTVPQQVAAQAPLQQTIRPFSEIIRPTQGRRKYETEGALDYFMRLLPSRFLISRFFQVSCFS
jgi:hypothetical protein